MPRIEKYCMVGALGWNHPDWGQSYYPDDIPQEWRMPFFAHEFDLLLLPQADWLAAGADFLEAMEEIQSECRMLLQLDWGLPVLEKELAMKKMGELRELISGVVIQAPPEALSDKAAFSRLASLLGEDVQLAIELTGVEGERLPQLPDRYQTVWSSSELEREQAPAVIGLVRDWADRTDPGLRRLVDLFTQQVPADAQGVSLIFVDQPPSIALMSRIQELLENMGLSDRN